MLSPYLSCPFAFILGISKQIHKPLSLGEFLVYVRHVAEAQPCAFLFPLFFLEIRIYIDLLSWLFLGNRLLRIWKLWLMRYLELHDNPASPPAQPPGAAGKPQEQLNVVFVKFSVFAIRFVIRLGNVFICSYLFPVWPGTVCLFGYLCARLLSSVWLN